MIVARRARAFAARVARAVRRSPLETAVFLGALGVALYVLVFPFGQCRYPPFTDLPFHATGASILRHYADPDWHFREQFTLEFLKVPYWTLYVLGASFASFLPIVPAVKLATILCLAALPVGLSILAHGMKKSPYLGLFGLMLVWNELTYWGFVNFVAAVGLFAATVGAALLVVDRPTASRRVGLAIALFLVFATHVFRFPFAVAAVIGTGVVLYPATRRFRPLLLPLLPALALFAASIALRDPPSAPTTLGLGWHGERLSEMGVRLFDGWKGPRERQVAAEGALALVGVATANLVAAIAARRWRAWSSRDRRFHVGAHVAVLACVLVFFAGYLTLPMSIGMWWYVYPREILAAAALACALVPDLPRSSLARLALLAVVGWAASRPARLAADGFARFAADGEDFHAMVAALPRAPRLAYLVYDHGGSQRTQSPVVHLPAWAQAERGGWLSFHFFAWNAAPIRYRPYDPSRRDVPPPAPPRVEFIPSRFDWERQAPFFDWFLVRAPAAPEGVFAEHPEFRLFAHSGAWWLYRREPSP